VYFDFVNLFAGEKKTDLRFDDRSVCKSFLLGCCPHEILSATVCIITVVVVLIFAVAHKFEPLKMSS